MSLWSRITGQDAIRAQLDELRAANRELTEMRSIDTLPWSVGSDTLPARAASPSRVMGMPAVYAAIRLIGEAVSTMPVRAYRETATGGKVRIPLPQLIRSPGIHGDITQFLSQVMYALLVHGNAFLLVLNRDGYGYPTTCQVLKDEECYVEDMNQFGRGSYQDPIFRWRGREIDIDQIIHLKWLSQPERIRGITPLSVLAAPTDIGLESNKYAVDWFKGGGIPPGTFANSDMKLSQPEAEQVKAGLVTSIRQHAPIVYGKGWDYKPIQIAPHEAEFVNSLKMSANQVAAIYGIYPSEYLAGESKNNQTYANVVAEMLQFQQFTLRPWLEKIESIIFNQLPAPVYIRFDMNAALRIDPLTRWQIYQIQRQIGATNIDEIRDEEDMAPLPNDQGQEYAPLITVKETEKVEPLGPEGNPNEPPGLQVGPEKPAGSPAPAPSGEPEQNGQRRSPHPPAVQAQIDALRAQDPALSRWRVLLMTAETDEQRAECQAQIDRLLYGETPIDRLLHTNGVKPASTEAPRAIP